MKDIDLKIVTELLKVLRENNVEVFEHDGLKVQLRYDMNEQQPIEQPNEQMIDPFKLLGERHVQKKVDDELGPAPTLPEGLRPKQELMTPALYGFRRSVK